MSNMRVARARDDVDQELQNAAWYYPTPKDKAENIKDHVAFCKSSERGCDRLCFLCKTMHEWCTRVHPPP